MKRFVLAIALACALSVMALAGEIPTSDVAAPPPPQASSPIVAIILTIISIVR
ncbi:MAG: hypothetical protein M3R69_09480 [Acidobacteriota bacterium]|nr:hypothetical protein [Acidobacteriota bacterium]